MTSKKFALHYSRAIQFAKKMEQAVEPVPEPQWADGHAQDRAAFEQKIDENPTDPNTHLTYSDWLRDNGHEDEADFRKAMGEWHANKKWAYQNHNDLPENVRPSYSHSVTLNKTGLPDGVTGVPHRYPTDSDYHFAPSHIGRYISTANRLGWKSYRDMEEGLRRAFMANKKESN